MYTFLNNFDPAIYAGSQHGPILTIIGTHDQYFTIPAINSTYNQTASAGTNPRFISRIQFAPNGEHGVINQSDFLPTFLSVLDNANRWLRHSFKNAAPPPETPVATMRVVGRKMYLVDCGSGCTQ